MTKITTNEARYLACLIADQYHDGRDPVGNPVWSWSVADTFGGTRTASGVASSLARKGLVICDGYGGEATITLTQAGADAVKGGAA